MSCLNDDVAGQSDTLTLDAALQSSRRARQHVARFIAREHLIGVTENLNIIVGELVANAVMHSTAPIALGLSYGGGTVRVEVTDGTSDLGAVRFREVDCPTIGGRGLRILAALVDEWGIVANETGKSVWAKFKAAHE
jgi:anti-sigma regulatory factor (Ser/Thr protein kinase)